MSSEPTTLREVDKEATIAAFADYLGREFYEETAKILAEDLFAEIQGRERTFRSLLTSPLDPADHKIRELWVEVTDE